MAVLCNGALCAPFVEKMVFGKLVKLKWFCDEKKASLNLLPHTSALSLPVSHLMK